MERDKSVYTQFATDTAPRTAYPKRASDAKKVDTGQSKRETLMLKDSQVYGVAWMRPYLNCFKMAVGAS